MVVLPMPFSTDIGRMPRSGLLSSETLEGPSTDGLSFRSGHVPAEMSPSFNELQILCLVVSSVPVPVVDVTPERNRAVVVRPHDSVQSILAVGEVPLAAVHSVLDAEKYLHA